jgi:hypothetical protein
MVRRLLLTLLALAMASCLPGDGYVVLQGAVLDQGGQPFDDCRAQLHDAKGRAIFDARPIKGRFREDFVIEPRQREYFISVVFDSAISVVRSEVFVAGTREQWTQNVQIGNLLLQRAASERSQ